MPKPTIQELINDHYEAVKRGEVDHANYRATCPLRTKACKEIICEKCRYFIPPIEEARPPKEEGEPKCAHCGKGEDWLRLVGDWQPKIEIPTIDGIHNMVKYGEETYRRVACEGCGLITDLPLGPETPVVPEALAASYANPMRQMHRDIQERLDSIHRTVIDSAEALAAMIPADADTPDFVRMPMCLLESLIAVADGRAIDDELREDIKTVKAMLGK